MKLVVLRTWPVKSPRGMPPMRKIRKDAWRTDEYIRQHDRIRKAIERAA